ncbi:MAG: hypothetical protein WBW48_01260 [Anaerolineae bacterium]
MHRLSKLTHQKPVTRLVLILMLVLLILTALIVGLFLRRAQPSTLDVMSAMSAGLMQVDVTVDGYHSAQIEVTNTSNSPQEVIVPQGLQLINGNTSHQNLAIGEEKTLQISPGETVSVTVPTYCISPHRGSPSPADDFLVGGLVSDEVLKILRSGQPSNFIQEAVWRQIDSENIPTGFIYQNHRRELHHAFGKFLDLLLTVTLMLGAVTLSSVVRLSYFETKGKAFEESWWRRWLRYLKAVVVQVQQRIARIWKRIISFLRQISWWRQWPRYLKTAAAQMQQRIARIWKRITRSGDR